MDKNTNADGWWWEKYIIENLLNTIIRYINFCYVYILTNQQRILMELAEKDYYKQDYFIPNAINTSRIFFTQQPFKKKFSRLIESQEHYKLPTAYGCIVHITEVDVSSDRNVFCKDLIVFTR